MSRSINNVRGYLLMLPVSLIGGLVTAYACAMTFDGKIEMVDIAAVFPYAAFFGLIGGALVSPLLYFCLRGKDKKVAIPFVYGLAAVGTAGLNLAAHPAGFRGAFIVVPVILLLWKRFGRNAKEESKPTAAR